MAKTPGKKAFVKFGDWDKAINMSNGMSSAIDKSVRQTMGRVTLKAERWAVKFMSEQSLSWQPLSNQYLDKKARAGLSSKILIATSTYFQSITSKVEGYNGFTGVFRQVKSPDGQEVADIAAIHEYGSIARNIPPRRLWGVVFQHTRSWLIKNKPFAVEALNQIKKQGGIQ